MFALVSLLYEGACSVLPFSLVLLLLRLGGGRYGRRGTPRDWVLPGVFALYVTAVFHVTGAGTLYQLLEGGFQQIARRINLLPFSREISPVGYGLNVVLFLPFGMLVPLIWKKLAGLVPVLLSGCGFSLLIEVSQLLSQRSSDVDDLIMNTLGAGLGYLLYKGFPSLIREKFQQNAAPVELPLFLVTLYLGRCLFFHYLGLIRLWYGI